jgi:3-dehydroquinate synthase
MTSSVAQPTMTTSVTVDLGDRSYPIHIGSGQISRANIGQYIEGWKALIVTNTSIAPLYLQAVVDQLQEKHIDTVILDDGEKYKNLDNLNHIYTELINQHHDRKTTLIALGGGVVGDMTGFAAACYQRGVPFIQIPTTLLAQVDSSVGGKTAVNHSLGKNMIGAFYQPQAVIIDTDTLSTLPDREFRAGMAEVIKYGLISDSGFFSWLEDNMTALLQRDSAALAYAIKYSDWLHGEAVAAGMVMAAQMSVLAGDISADELQRATQLISACGLPTTPPSGMTSEDFMQLMVRDKKVLDGQLRLVLLNGIGHAVVRADFQLSLLEQVLNEACHVA